MSFWIYLKCFFFSGIHTYLRAIKKYLMIAGAGGVAPTGSEAKDVLDTATGGTQSSHNGLMERNLAPISNDSMDTHNAQKFHSSEDDTPAREILFRTAYLMDLRFHGIDKYPNEVLAKLLGQQVLGLTGVVRLPNSSELNFITTDARDAAVKKAVLLNGQNIKLTLPDLSKSIFKIPDVPVRTRLKLRHIPTAITNKEIDFFFGEQGYTVVSPCEPEFYKSTPTLTSGVRYLTVECKSNVVIPTSFSFKTLDMKRAISFMVSYAGMPVVCHRCSGHGHIAEACPEYPEIANKKTLKDINHALEVDLANNAHKFMSADYVAEAGDENIPKELLDEKESSPMERLLEERGKGQESIIESEPQVNTFCAAHPTNAALSNFTKVTHPFDFNDRKWTSTEQALQVSRAKLAGDAEAAKKISRATRPTEMKAVAETIDWKGTPHAYLKFSFDCLYRANKEKFKSNPVLMKSFMDTPGSFTETNTGRNSIWGSGLTYVEPAVKNRGDYNLSKNLFGQLLTLLKFELRKEVGWKPPDRDGELRPRAGSFPGVKRGLDDTVNSDIIARKVHRKTTDSLSSLVSHDEGVKNISVVDDVVE
jgi:ribA/ribD-fused uncharacterized protein